MPVVTIGFDLVRLQQARGDQWQGEEVCGAMMSADTNEALIEPSRAEETASGSPGVPGRPGRWPALVVATGIVMATYWFSPNFSSQQPFGENPFAGDFLQEWVGGYIVRVGDWQRFYDVSYAKALEHNRDLVGFSWDRASYLPIVYPPFYYLLMSPLSLLPFKTATWVWVALMVGCFAATVFLAGRWLETIKPSATTNPSATETASWMQHIVWAIPVSVMFGPLLENLTTCQKGTVCLLIVTATFYLLQRQRPLSAGLIFGLLAFKPQLVLVIAIAMCWKRQWRFVCGGAITGLTLVGLSFAMGTDVCGQYVKFATGTADYISTGGYDLHKSHCWYGFFTLLTDGSAAGVARTLTLLASGATIGMTAWLLRGELRPERPEFARQYSGLIVATVLLSPHLFTYDLTILLLPMFLLTSLIGCGRLPAKLSAQLAWLLLGLYWVAGCSPLLARLTGLQLTPLLMFAVLFVLAKARVTRPLAGELRQARPGAIEERSAQSAMSP